MGVIRAVGIPQVQQVSRNIEPRILMSVKYGQTGGYAHKSGPPATTEYSMAAQFLHPVTRKNINKARMYVREMVVRSSVILFNWIVCAFTDLATINPGYIPQFKIKALYPNFLEICPKCRQFFRRPVSILSNKSNCCWYIITSHQS